MEKKEEIIILDKDELIVPKHDFERVDFSDAGTIINYGDDVRNKISAVFKSTAEMSSSEEEIIIDEKKLRKSLDLDSSLDESDKESNKKELAVFTGVKNILTKIGVKKFEEKAEKNSYKAKFAEYCKQIEAVTEAVKSQKTATLHDFETKKNIIANMLPLIEELEEVINVGKQDLLGFEKELNDLKAQHEQEGGADLYQEIQVKSMLYEIFSSKLDELDRELTLYKEQIQAYRLQQGTDLITANKQDSYIRAMGPVLTAQGSLLINNRIGKRRLDTMQGLNDLSNDIVQENAVQLQENAQKGADLYVNGGITTETLTKLHTSLMNGFKIYTEARTLKMKKIERDQTVLSKLQQSMDSYENELAGFLSDDRVMEALKGGSSMSLDLRPKTGRK